jgi:hypothetical protein
MRGRRRQRRGEIRGCRGRVTAWLKAGPVHSPLQRLDDARLGGGGAECGCGEREGGGKQRHGRREAAEGGGEAKLLESAGDTPGVTPGVSTERSGACVEGPPSQPRHSCTHVHAHGADPALSRAGIGAACTQRTASTSRQVRGARASGCAARGSWG